MRVTVRRIDGSDEDEFIAAAKASRLLHKAWVAPPLTRDAFAKYIARFERPSSYGFVVVAMPSGELVGAINTPISFGVRSRVAMWATSHLRAKRARA